MMNRLFGTAFIVSIFATGVAQAANDQGGNQVTMDYGATSLIGDGSLPSTRYPTLSLVSGQLGTGLKVGCDGMTMGNIAGQAGEQLSYLGDYISNNALSLAYNYLIYSQPTLYSLMTNMNEHIEKSIDVNLASCQSIRDRAKETQKEVAGEIAEAEAKCLASGNSAAVCNDGDKIRTYAAAVFKDASKAMSGTVAAIKTQTGMGGGKDGGGNGSGSNAPNVKGDNPTEFVGITGGIPKDLYDDFEKLYPPREENGGDPVWKSRQVIPKEIYNRYYEEYTASLVNLVSLVSGAPSSTDGADGTPASFTEVLTEYNKDPYIKPLNREFIVDLYQLSSFSRDEYQYAVRALARSQAFARLEQQVSIYERAILNSTSGAYGSQLKDTDKARFIETTAFVKREVDAIRYDFESKERQREVAMGIIEYTRQSLRHKEKLQSGGM